MTWEMHDKHNATCEDKQFQEPSPCTESVVEATLKRTVTKWSIFTIGLEERPLARLARWYASV